MLVDLDAAEMSIISAHYARLMMETEDDIYMTRANIAEGRYIAGGFAGIEQAQERLDRLNEELRIFQAEYQRFCQLISEAKENQK